MEPTKVSQIKRNDLSAVSESKLMAKLPRSINSRSGKRSPEFGSQSSVKFLQNKPPTMIV